MLSITERSSRPLRLLLPYTSYMSSTSSISSKRRHRVRFRYCCSEIMNRVKEEERNSEEKLGEISLSSKSSRSKRTDKDTDKGIAGYLTWSLINQWTRG